MAKPYQRKMKPGHMRHGVTTTTVVRARHDLTLSARQVARALRAAGYEVPDDARIWVRDGYRYEDLDLEDHPLQISWTREQLARGFVALSTPEESKTEGQ